MVIMVGLSRLVGSVRFTVASSIKPCAAHWPRLCSPSVSCFFIARGLMFNGVSVRAQVWSSVKAWEEATTAGTLACRNGTHYHRRLHVVVV